jgi:methylamine---glutamate N-methyltransferase subunit B
VSPRPSDGSTPPEPPDAIVAVPEIRDYDLINKELAQLLSDGARRIVLNGVDGQRLLASKLRGPWVATIEVDGHAGPELAAELDAPGLTISCRGSAADGAARSLQAGRVVIEGDAGESLGYALRGGLVLVRGATGHRAGLMQAGGIIVLAGKVGRLANERQTGGSFHAWRHLIGPYVSRGRRGGQVVLNGPDAELPLNDIDRLEAFLRAERNPLRPPEE